MVDHQDARRAAEEIMAIVSRPEIHLSEGNYIDDFRN